MSRPKTNRKDVVSDIKRMNKERSKNDLPPIRYGNRECLKCEDEFFSENLKQEKMCYKCRSYYSGRYQV